jgi:O-antigen biosynthesis protein WbqP
VNGVEPFAGLASSGYPAKRLIDIVLASLVMILAIVPGFLIALLVILTSEGPALYWSERVGRHNRNFSMPKYRTMRIDTPAVATHLMDDPETYLTPPGRLLRKTSLDELPQLWSVLRGDMSLVGPRPALFNQDDLIALRTEAGVDGLLPGLTGWAQINGRDELPIPDKVRLDVEYLRRQSFLFDMKILLLTIKRVVHGHGVAH